MPDVGEQAPLFEGPSQDGDTIRLDAYRGRKVALYFYPKDDWTAHTSKNTRFHAKKPDILPEPLHRVSRSKRILKTTRPPAGLRFHKPCRKTARPQSE